MSGLRLYTRFFPIQKGKGLLQKVMQPWMASLGEIDVTSIYGTKFRLRFPDDHGWEYLYTLGTVETGTSELCRQVLRPGDVVFDIGANIGWYTCLSANCVTTIGTVHAFEPVPWIYEKLVVNCTLNSCTSAVIMNKLAIGEDEGVMELFSFKGRPHGETSAKLRDGLAVESSVVANVTNLDTYIKGLDGTDIALIKVDIEGAEWLLLNGAKQLLSSAHLPMWIFEMGLETATAFGWSPYDLLNRLRHDCNYRFVRVEGAWGRAIPVKSVKECEQGDNVLCYVPELHRDRLIDTVSGFFR